MKLKIYFFQLYFLMLLTMVAKPAHSDHVFYSILDYGATLDTTVVQTDAIQAAIDACNQAGGGTVLIPAGTFTSGTLYMRDHVSLHLAAGATLAASDSYADFPMIPPASYRSLKDVSGWSALIYAEGVRSIGITGQGVIDGRGKGRRGRPGTAGGDRDGRPRNILFISCQKVFVSGVTIRNAAMWNQHYLDCEDVTVDGIHVYNHANGNNDGIDIDGCRRFVLTNSIIDADDDGIVLKSTGLAPCEDVVINNCIVSSFANAIKLGTESTGGYRNILISNCIVRPSRHMGERTIKSTESGITAISLEVVDGGVMDGVQINNVQIEGTECPLYIRLANRGRKHRDDAPTPEIGRMRNIHISNVTAYNVGNFGSSITGIPGGRIENVSLSNIRFYNKGGLKAGSFTSAEVSPNKRHDMIKDLSFDTYWKSYKDIVEDEKGYPQPTVWQNLPSYGLFVRHVEQINLHNVLFESQEADPRPFLNAISVGDLVLDAVQPTASANKLAVFHKVDRYRVDKSIKLKIDR